MGHREALSREISVSHIIVDNTGKRDVFSNLCNFDSNLVTRLTIRYDHDVSVFHFCDTVALLTDGLNRHIPNLTFINRRS